MTRRKPKNAPEPASAPTSPGVALVEWTPDARNVPLALTPAGLALVEQAAGGGGSQGLIASRLGVARSTFQKTMERDEPVRLAYERGRAEMEHSLVDGLRKSAAKGYAPAAMFLLKTQFGYRENDPVIPQQQNAIIITLPDSLSPEQWQERQRQRAALAAPIIDVEHKVITNGGTDAE